MIKDQISPYYVDLHTHALAHGASARLRISDTVRGAKRKGIMIMGLTDHVPLPHGFDDPTPDRDCAMSQARYEVYRKRVKAVKVQEAKRGQIEILEGGEYDWLGKKYEAAVRERAETLGHDYRIGSIHFLKNPNDDKYYLLDFSKDWFEKAISSFGGMQNLITAYFREIGEMARSGIFQVVGHMDLFKKYKPDFYPEADWYKKAYGEALSAINDAGLAIEINTAGTRKCGEQYPSRSMLEKAYSMGIPLSVGSDAHMPSDIGSGINEALGLARSIGWQEGTVHRNLVPYQIII